MHRPSVRVLALILSLTGTTALISRSATAADQIAFYDFSNPGQWADWTADDDNPADGLDYWGVVDDAGLHPPYVWCAANSDGGAQMWVNYDNSMIAWMERTFSLVGYQKLLSTV
jgi:hypothetical protein